jgi:hypothetical protein
LFFPFGVWFSHSWWQVIGWFAASFVAVTLHASGLIGALFGGGPFFPGFHAGGFSESGVGFDVLGRRFSFTRLDIELADELLRVESELAPQSFGGVTGDSVLEFLVLFGGDHGCLLFVLIFTSGPIR